jgi:hypothetical protein
MDPALSRRMTTGELVSTTGELMMTTGDLVMDDR